MRTASNWFPSYTGKRLFPADLLPEDIEIEHIAHSLSLLCRFNGSVRSHYSVAQHSCLVASILPPELQLCGLLHDATEAYCGDMIRPLKRMPGMGTYRGVEAKIWRVLAGVFGLPRTMPAEVKEADNRLLLTERRDLLPPHPWRWLEEDGPQPLAKEIHPWGPRVAEVHFLERFEALRGTLAP